jgi:hypothetical protein
MIASSKNQEHIPLERDFEQLEILYELYDLSRLIKHAESKIRKKRMCLGPKSTKFDHQDLADMEKVNVKLKTSKKQLESKLSPRFDFHVLTSEVKKLEKRISRWKTDSKNSVGKLALRKAKIENSLMEAKESVQQITASSYYYLRILKVKALSLVDQLDHIEELKEKGKISLHERFHLKEEVDVQLDLVLKKVRFLSISILDNKSLLYFEDE